MQLIWTRLLTLFAAALMALPAPALASSSYLCHMTGRVSESRCCTAKRATVCHAQVEEQDCCELMQAHGQATAPATRNDSHDVPSAALVAIAAFSLPARTPLERARESTTANTHPPGPPRFLLHCSFLI
jgi:hypothetical protein